MQGTRQRSKCYQKHTSEEHDLHWAITGEQSNLLQPKHLYSVLKWCQIENCRAWFTYSNNILIWQLFYHKDYGPRPLELTGLSDM